jgi:hypothetical protein
MADKKDAHSILLQSQKFRNVTGGVSLINVKAHQTSLETGYFVQMKTQNVLRQHFYEFCLQVRAFTALHQ